jgi:uncharacterized protein (DUF1501 family)
MSTRRDFLKAAPALPFFARAALQGAAPTGRILVVLQLAGGNDGLNTVVPYEDDQYGRRRTTLRLTDAQVHKVGNLLGFHPVLGGFARLLGEGHLAVLQGVGYPNMQRDHGAGMRNWQTASLSPDEQTGWLGRASDLAADLEQGKAPAVFVGSIPPPLSNHARQSVIPHVHELSDWTVAAAPQPARPLPQDPLLRYVSRTTAAAHAGAGRVRAAGRGREYPPYTLAQSLRTVAQLIRAELGISIFLTEQGGAPPGGFDNHANQAGNHAVVLRELSDSVTAFVDDLARDRLLDRVLLMTYSEFGRTLTENGRHGTSHGAAAPVFLAGGGVRGGFIGSHPSLHDLDNDAPKPHTDFRALYATVLERWLGMDSRNILGGAFPRLEVLA